MQSSPPRPLKERLTNESRADECLQDAERTATVRSHQDFASLAGSNPALEPRRSEEAGNDQLSYVQTGTRWPVLRAHLRTRERLRVLVRQVQAHEVQGYRLREVRRRGHGAEGTPRSYGAY